MKDIKLALETVQSWAATIICNRGTSISPAQAVWAMYPHMQLLKATETILESMAYAEESKMVNLPELEERDRIVIKHRILLNFKNKKRTSLIKNRK